MTNAKQACLIITYAYSTQAIIEELGLIGKTNPPMSHLSDFAFMEWERACSFHDVELETLKHMFLSVIETHSTQDVVHRVLADKTAKPIESWSDLAQWEGRECFTHASAGWHALLGTIQVKGIMWMLLQHRAQLGRKKIKTICVFRDTNEKQTDRGPSMYLELEDV